MTPALNQYFSLKDYDSLTRAQQIELKLFSCLSPEDQEIVRQRENSAVASVPPVAEEPPPGTSGPQPKAANIINTAQAPPVPVTIETSSVEPGALTAFENRALPLIARHIPVIPVPARMKGARLNNWQQLASTDPTQIAEWGKQEPDANVACVAKARPDGIWILEIDKPNFHVDVIQKQTGQKMPETLTVRSSEGRGHFYFRQTPESIAMGNRQGKDENGKEAWSARVSDRYCIGPGSVHPSGSVYAILVDKEIADAPQWLIDFCSQQQAKTGHAELDDVAPISEGSRNNSLASILGKAHQVLHMDKEQLFEYGRSVNEKRCHPPLSDREIRTIANSIGKYEVKPVPTLVLDKPNQAAQIPVTDRPLEQESVNHSEAPVNSLDHLPCSVLASSRLEDIYFEHFQDYGWPLTLALPALVTAASVVVPQQPRQGDLILGSDDLMTNLYTALIADVGAGKSQVINWASSAIGIYDPPIGQNYFEGKWGSAEQMLKSLHRKQSVFTQKSVLINPDEWAHLFAKAAIPDASFPTILTTSFYRRNQIFTLGGQDGGKEYQLNLAMSFIGGIVEQDFDTVFGAQTLGGLYDRFLFGRAPDRFLWNYQPCPIEPKKYWLDWNLRSVRIDPSVYEAVKGWSRKNPGLGRVSEICVRIAVIYASLDGRPAITGKDVEPLKDLALYQVGLRQMFRPNPGQTPDAVFANKALAWINKYAADWMSIAKLKQHTWRTEEKLGPAVAVRSLIGLARSGRIDLWTSDGGRELPSDYRGPAPRIGLVRRVK